MKSIITKLSAGLMALTLFAPIPAQAAMVIEPKAAPAIALEIAAMHDVTLTGAQTAAISRMMGTGASFMGALPTDPMYHHHVMQYLHEAGIIEMDGHCDPMCDME